MIVDHVHLNQLYENKTNFYRKLDAVCDSIHEFKSMQDNLMNRGTEISDNYQIPDFNDFSRVIHPTEFDNDDDFRRTGTNASPQPYQPHDTIPYDTLMNSPGKTLSLSPHVSKVPTRQTFHKQVNETVKTQILNKKEVFQMIFKGEQIAQSQAFGHI